MDVEFDAVLVLMEDNDFPPPIFHLKALPEIELGFFEDTVDLSKGLIERPPFGALLFQPQILPYLGCNHGEGHGEDLEDEATLALVDRDIFP